MMRRGGVSLGRHRGCHKPEAGAEGDFAAGEARRVRHRRCRVNVIAGELRRRPHTIRFA